MEKYNPLNQRFFAYVTEKPRSPANDNDPRIIRFTQKKRLRWESYNERRDEPSVSVSSLAFHAEGGAWAKLEGERMEAAASSADLTYRLTSVQT